MEQPRDGRNDDYLHSHSDAESSSDELPTSSLEDFIAYDTTDTAADLAAARRLHALWSERTNSYSSSYDPPAPQLTNCRSEDGINTVFAAEGDGLYATGGHADTHASIVFTPSLIQPSPSSSHYAIVDDRTGSPPQTIAPIVERALLQSGIASDYDFDPAPRADILSPSQFDLSSGTGDISMHSSGHEESGGGDTTPPPATEQEQQFPQSGRHGMILYLRVLDKNPDLFYSH